MNTYLIGVLYALSSAFLFSLNTVATRRGVYEGNIFEAVTISIVIGIPIFLVASSLSGQLTLKDVDYKFVLLFILVGILHFIIGRYLLYSSIHHIGASTSAPITGTTQVFAVILAFIILKERVNLIKGIGIILSMAGILILITPYIKISSMKRGLFLALIATFIFAVTSILIRHGLNVYHKPFLAVLISYISAILIFIFPSNKGVGKSMKKLGKEVILYILLASIFVDVGQLLRYSALDVIEVSILSSIYASIPVQVLIYSYIVNREYEEFDRWKIISTIIVTLGVILVIYSGV